MPYQPSSAMGPTSSFFDDAIEAPDLHIETGAGFPVQLQSEHSSQTLTTSAESTLPYSSEELDDATSPPPLEDGNEKETSTSRNNSQSSQSSSGSSSTRGRDRPRSAAANTQTNKPKKRGRKPKKRPKELDDLFHEDEELDEDGLPKDPRRRRILERNRIAATKCRLRKRDEASALASREQAMEDQNRYLSSCFDSLTAEIYHLKTQLLRHTDCGCVLIQKYIAHEAKRSVDNMMGVPTTCFQMDAMSPEFNGSSGSSSVDSMNTSPEAESVHTPWAHAFPQMAPMPHPQNDMMLGMGHKDMLHDAGIEHALPMTAGHVEGCNNNGMVVGMAPHQHPVGGVAWNPQWEIR